MILMPCLPKLVAARTPPATAFSYRSFQSPVEIPGVSNIDFLRIATNARRTAKGEKELDPLEFYAHVMPKLEALNMDPSFLNRNVNEGFSGALFFLSLHRLCYSPCCQPTCCPQMPCPSACMCACTPL